MQDEREKRRDGREVSAHLASERLSAVVAAGLERPPIQRFEFLPFNPNDARFITHLHLAASQLPPTRARLENWGVQLTRSDGTPIGSPWPTMTASFEQQDTVATLAWYPDDDGSPLIGVHGVYRVPMMAARDGDNGWRLQLPGGYVLPESGASSLDHAVDVVLAEKLGVERDGPTEFLGGGFYSSSGWLTEAVIPRAVRVKRPPHQKSMRFGERFHATITAEFLPPQEIVDGYFRGEHHDVRLLEAVFRFCRYKGIPLQVPVKPSAETRSQIPEHPDSRVASKELIRALSQSPDFGGHEAVSVVITPARQSADEQFVSRGSLSVQAKNAGGETLQTFDAEVVSRRGMDVCDLFVYGWMGEKLYGVVQRGPRPIVAVRNYEPHFVHTDTNVFNVDGIAGSFEAWERSRDLRTARAKTILTHKTGLTAVSEPLYIGTVEPSPGYTTERADQYLVEVDLRSCEATPENEVYIIELDDMLDLADQGVLRDIRVTEMAHVLKSALSYGRRANSEGVPVQAQTQEYLEFINSGSAIQEWLSIVSPKVDADLSQHVNYRRLKTLAENELGLAVLALSHPDEYRFFRAGFPIFSFRPPDQREKWPFNLIHDLRHYLIGDFLPFHFDEEGRVTYVDGAPQTYTFEEYRRICGRAECEAVWYSDVLMPELFGADAVAAFSWRGEVAKLFQAHGISTEEAREMILEIELERRIPQTLRDSEHFSNFRPAIEKLLRFSFLDEAQLRIFYDNWMRSPAMAEIAMRFGNHSGDAESYVSRIRSSIERIKDYSEGVNPLRAGLNRTASVDVASTALRLGWIRELICKTQGKGWEAARELITHDIEETLSTAYLRLRERANWVATIEASPENLAEFSLMRRIRTEILPRIVEAADTYSAAKELLTDEQRATLDGRLLPFFDSQEITDPAQLQEIERRVAEVLA